MVRTQRAAFLAALALAFVPISASVTSPCPHTPLGARARGRADPALFLQRPALDSTRVGTERAGSPWGHRSAVGGEGRQTLCLWTPGKEGSTVGDDRSPSGAEGEARVRFKWGALGRMRGGGGGGGWRGPPGDAYGGEYPPARGQDWRHDLPPSGPQGRGSGGYYQGQAPVQGGAGGGWEGWGGGSGYGRVGRGDYSGWDGGGREEGWRGGGDQGRGRGVGSSRPWREAGRSEYGTAAFRPF